MERILHVEVGYCIAAADLTQAAVARKLGISQKHLSRMLTGKVPMSPEWADRITMTCGYRLQIQAVPDARVAQPGRASP